jgi:hypothetical protein
MIIPTLLAPGELGIMRERYPLKILDSGDHIELVSVFVFENYSLEMPNKLLLLYFRRFFLAQITKHSEKHNSSFSKA